MREPVFRCPRCESKLSEGEMADETNPESGYCPECENIVHEPEQIGERIHLYTKTALACRSHETLPQLAESCEELAEYARQLDAEGFEVFQTSGDGHIFAEKIETDAVPDCTSSSESPDQNSEEEEQDKPVEYWF